MGGRLLLGTGLGKGAGAHTLHRPPDRVLRGWGAAGLGGGRAACESLPWWDALGLKP